MKLGTITIIFFDGYSVASSLLIFSNPFNRRAESTFASFRGDGAVLVSDVLPDGQTVEEVLSLSGVVLCCSLPSKHNSAKHVMLF